MSLGPCWNGCEGSWFSSGAERLLSRVIVGQVTKTSKVAWVGTGAATTQLPLVGLWDLFSRSLEIQSFMGQLIQLKKQSSKSAGHTKWGLFGPQRYPFVTSDLEHLHGLDFVSDSPLVSSFLLTGLLLLNPLTGREKIHFLLLLGDSSDKRWLK